MSHTQKSTPDVPKLSLDVSPQTQLLFSPEPPPQDQLKLPAGLINSLLIALNKSQALKAALRKMSHPGGFVTAWDHHPEIPHFSRFPSQYSWDWELGRSRMSGVQKCHCCEGGGT